MSDDAISTDRHLSADVLNRISRLEMRARHVVEGFISGMHESPFKGFSIEFADHREYAPGDDLRHLDWRVHAKTDRLYVKEYEVETNVRTHLLLDCSGSMAYPTDPPADQLTKWDYAATLALSLAHLLVGKQGDAAGLLLFNDRVRQHVPFSASLSSLHELAQTMILNSPDGETNVKASFGELIRAVPRRGTVIVFSDLLIDPEEFVDALAQLQSARHDVVVFHVLDRDELEFPFSDRILFEGIEDQGSEVLTDPQSLRSSYLEAVARFTERLAGECLDRRIDYTLFSTADPIPSALGSYLADRMHRLGSRR